LFDSERTISKCAPGVVVLGFASLLAGRAALATDRHMSGFIRGERIRFPLIVIGCFLFPLIAIIRSLFGAAFPPINFRSGK
jgi:hypothetical protein